MRRLVLLPALIAILVGAPPALAWTWPVDGPVLQPFSVTSDPYASGQHRGIDVGTAEGEPVRAPASGTVTFAGTVPGGGRSITIQTPDGLAVTLLHLGTVLVSEGDAVAEEVQVGVGGWSGDAEHTVPSIHLGVRIATQSAGYLDPLTLLPSLAPPPAPSDVAVDVEDEPDELDEPAAITVVGADGDEATIPAIEVATLSAQPDEAAATPEALLQAAQPDFAEPAGVEVAPLEPLVVVPALSTEPPEPSEAPADTATPEPVEPEPAESAQSHAAFVTAAAAATSSAPTSSSGDPTRPAKSTVVALTSAPADHPDSPREGQRRRADRHDPAGRAHRVRIDRRAAPSVEGGLAAARDDARSFEHGTRTPSHHVGRPEHGVAPAPASSGGAWLWRAGLATILAALAVVLLVRRSRRGGQGTAGLEKWPSAPPLGAAQAPEPGVGAAPVLPVARRDPRALTPRPGRRLDRGGPGGPAKHPAAGLRGRRASV